MLPRLYSFIACIFLAPIAGLVPAAATAPALIVVGIMMMSAFKEIKWDDLNEAIPAFFWLSSWLSAIVFLMDRYWLYLLLRSETL